VVRPGDTSRIQEHGAIRATPTRRHAFSLIDLLVSIAVIAVLISIISPTLAHVRDAADKIVCASNLRQVGLCLSMYRDDYDGLLPSERRERFARTDYDTPDPQIAHTGENPSAWSGLGYLVADGYLSAPEVLYCPAHPGEVNHENYASAWRMLDREIRTNYAYRGSLAADLASVQAYVPQDGAASAHTHDTSQQHAVLVADAFSTPNDISHASGFNTLSLSLSVTWHSDPNDEIVTLARSSAASGGVNPNDAWTILDRENERTYRVPESYSDNDTMNGLRLPRRPF